MQISIHALIEYSHFPNNRAGMPSRFPIIFRPARAVNIVPTGLFRNPALLLGMTKMPVCKNPQRNMIPRYIMYLKCGIHVLNALKLND